MYAEMLRVRREEERARAAPLMQSAAVLDLTLRLQPQLLQLVISQRCNILRAGAIFCKIPVTPGSPDKPPRTPTNCPHLY